jgi:hypothetical protein
MVNVNFNQIEEEISTNIVDALKKHDEQQLKKEIIRLMKLFLEGKSDAYNIDAIASYYLNADAFWKECKDYEISDPILRDTYEELTVFDDYANDDVKAREIIHNLLKKLGA